MQAKMLEDLAHAGVTGVPKVMEHGNLAGHAHTSLNRLGPFLPSVMMHLWLCL